VQSQQLPTESQVFEDEVRPATERTDQPAEEMPERHDHGKNFSGKDRIKFCAKSLISQVYDLLARRRGWSQAKPPSWLSMATQSKRFCITVAGLLASKRIAT
jgi:hypothetical protein